MFSFFKVYAFNVVNDRYIENRTKQMATNEAMNKGVFSLYKPIS